MATYAIGDVQGCFATLKALLAKICYNAERDTIWLAGDLVNRGPDSLGVLRWAQAQSGQVIAVLGNHDAHLLARAAQLAPIKKRDTLAAVLNAPDRDALLTWLAAQPILYERDGWAMVHGGLHPHWDIATARTKARAVEAVLRRNAIAELYTQRTHGVGADLRIFSTIRYVYGDGEPEFRSNMAPSEAPLELQPWFAARVAVANRVEEPKVVFGHWSTLGLHFTPKTVCLDTGCVWGDKLTAMRLEDGAIFQVDACEEFVGGD